MVALATPRPKPQAALPLHAERDNLDLRENQERPAEPWAALSFFASVFLMGVVLALVMWGGVGEP